MNRYRKSIVSLFLCLCMFFALIPAQALAVSQSEIDALKAERDIIRAQRKEKQALVQQLEADRASVVETKQAMDERNMYTLMQIQLNNREIEMYDEMIIDKAKEIDEAEQLEHEQLERYRSRVRAMEENSNISYLALVLKANNLGELLTAIDDIGEIMSNDKAVETAYIEARENTEKVKADYEEYKGDIQIIQEELRREQVELEKDIEEATRLITDLENDLEQRQQEYDAIMEAEEAANATIDKLVAQIEAERRAAAEAAAQAAAQAAGQGASGGGTVYGNGSFIFPVASYAYISSRFGLRIHPITGVKKSHTGMDIASNQGTSVYAADGGKVTLASWNGGYGNCIMVDHGNGYVTLYGHLSGYNCKAGDIVSQGSVIGYVGSTGNSTGPHLHFEVLKNGTRIDPEQFYSGLNISADAGV